MKEAADSILLVAKWGEEDCMGRGSGRGGQERCKHGRKEATSKEGRWREGGKKWVFLAHVANEEFLLPRRAADKEGKYSDSSNSQFFSFTCTCTVATLLSQRVLESPKLIVSEMRRRPKRDLYLREKAERGRESFYLCKRARRLIDAKLNGSRI